MKRIVLMVLVVGVTLLSAMTKRSHHVEDDWEYNASAPLPSGANPLVQSRGVSGPMMGSPVAKSLTTSNIGMAVGGAKDVDNFVKNIEQGYLPKLHAITYEGQFYQHYFDTGLGELQCKELFCPSYSTAKRKNHFADQEEYFLSVGLNSGMKAQDFKRKKLNLVVVLDISGSMGGTFNRYYYEQRQPHAKEANATKVERKIEIATHAIVTMLSHLKDDDRLGIVLFDNQAYLAKPLRLVGKSDKEAIRNHILELRERGGTNWSAGYQTALKLFEGLDRSSAYENRIIFLTDAMPNRGELSKDKLFGLAKKASEAGIYTTFVGVGVDFNPDLVEYVSKTRGANYFSVHSAQAFSKLLDEEFEYMVTPLVYDLVLKVESKGYAIEAVYGSPDAQRSMGEVMRVNTLFPSKQLAGKNRGGIILLKLKKIASGGEPLRLKLSYTDREGNAFYVDQNASFKEIQGDYFDTTGIRKAILISDYVTIMKNWIMDARAGCNDQIKWLMEEYPQIMKRCMVFPPKRSLYPLVKTWERSACPLQVSEGYHQLFQEFKAHYLSEMKFLNDESLQEELKVLEMLLAVKPKSFKRSVVDDWRFKQ